ncbi:hypothetical protein [Collimonas pratensis]|uniref:Lipoprotein n=1 Tax=Collimonas pratensis TaxID=279113 RepID=A0ABM5Z989_9BURK|nr:hypothetical protein [Collimonas pratensis]AMP15519.1 hypothetical protein CPter291_3282 [Collimonas pratensis]
MKRYCIGFVLGALTMFLVVLHLAASAPPARSSPMKAACYQVVT